MKSILSVLIFCGFLISYAYGETLETSNGSYEGEVVNGRPHGTGVYVGNDGSRYVGEFKNGKMHGQGTYTFDSTKYVGEWKDNEAWEGIVYEDGTIAGLYSEGVFHPKKADEDEDRVQDWGIKVPDWNSPDWNKENREFAMEHGITMDSIKFAEMWGFMSGIREFCEPDTSTYRAYLYAIGQILRRGYGNDETQMTILIMGHTLAVGAVMEELTQEDCDSETASIWLSIQDTSLNAWKDRGLQLPDK